MERLCCLLLMFLLIQSELKAAVQTIHFDILLFGDKIGVMTVTREEKPGGIEFYTLSSHSKAKILWINKENSTRYEVTYKDGRLISSTHKEYENSELKRWTNITLNGNIYQVDSYKGKRTFTEPPMYSIVTIYFKDLRLVKRIFYEAEADYDNVEHPEPDIWQFKSSDGNKNIYHFVNGQIKDTEFKVSIATVKMLRTD